MIIQSQDIEVVEESKREEEEETNRHTIQEMTEEKKQSNLLSVENINQSNFRDSKRSLNQVFLDQRKDRRSMSMLTPDEQENFKNLVFGNKSILSNNNLKESVASIIEEEKFEGYQEGGATPLRKELEENMKQQRGTLDSKLQFEERPNNTIFLETSKEQDERVRKNSPFGSLKTWKLLKLIVKSNDDVRQEQFAMQLIS